MIKNPHIAVMTYMGILFFCFIQFCWEPLVLRIEV